MKLFLKSLFSLALLFALVLPSQAQTITDTFTDTAGTALTAHTANPWVAAGGGASLIISPSGEVRSIGTASGSESAYITTSLASTPQYDVVTTVTIKSTLGTQAGPMACYNNGSGNWYDIVLDTFNNQFTVHRVAGLGTATSLTTAQTFSAGQVWNLKIAVRTASVTFSAKLAGAASYTQISQFTSTADLVLVGAATSTVGIVGYYSGSMTDTTGTHYNSLVETPFVASATSYTLTAPATATGPVGAASGNFTITPNAAVSASETFTPSDGGAGGTFTPATVTIAAASAGPGTFTYTPASTGAKTISIAAAPALGTDPAGVAYTGLSVAVTPAGPIAIADNATQTLTAATTGAATSVTWTLVSGLGTLSGQTGTTVVYTAPTNGSGASVVQASQGGVNSNSVTFNYSASPSVSINPATATVSQGGTQAFTETSNNLAAGVTWSVGGGGTLSSTTANPVTFTAGTTPGTYTLTATGSNGSTTSTAAITVAAVAVSISPSAISVTLSSTQQLTATVTGSVNTAVTYAVTEGAAGGTVSAGGLYTAPSTPGIYHVVATSSADGTKTATATLTVAATATYPVSVAFGPTIGTGQVVTYKLINSDGSVNTAATATGVLDLGAGSYGASVTTPAAFRGFITWNAPSAQTSTVVFAPTTSVTPSPTVSQIAAGILRTPANLLTTDSVGWVAVNNFPATVVASNLPADYQQRAVAVTLPTTAPTGYGAGAGGGTAQTGDLFALLNPLVSAGKFTAPALSLAPAGTGGGTVTVAGYAAGQDPATLLASSFAAVPASTASVLLLKPIKAGLTLGQLLVTLAAADTKAANITNSWNASTHVLTTVYQFPGDTNPTLTTTATYPSAQVNSPALLSVAGAIGTVSQP